MIQEVVPELNSLHHMPTTIDGIHQSVFRSSGVLNYILKMVERGDSKETIMDIYYSLMNGGEIKIKSEDLISRDLQTR